MKSFIFIIVYIVITFIITLIIRKIFKRINKLNPSTTVYFLGSFLQILVIILATFILLSLFEKTKDISKAILQSSSLIIAILTFSAQQVLGNVISGVILTFSKPYNIDEKIRVVSNGNIICEGVVRKMTIRHTEIVANNGQVSIVPNSVLDSSIIVNSNTINNIGNYFEVEVSYESNIEKAQNLLITLIKDIPEIINKDEVKVLVSRFEASGVVLKTTIWTKTLDDNFKVCSDLRKLILTNFPIQGIDIPYKTVTIKSI